MFAEFIHSSLTHWDDEYEVRTRDGLKRAFIKLHIASVWHGGTYIHCPWPMLELMSIYFSFCFPTIRFFSLFYCVFCTCIMDALLFIRPYFRFWLFTWSHAHAETNAETNSNIQQYKGEAKKSADNRAQELWCVYFFFLFLFFSFIFTLYNLIVYVKNGRNNI